MANTQMAGSQGWPPSAADVPSGRTRTAIGLGDAADPTRTTPAGNTPGTRGIDDHSQQNLTRPAGRASSGPGAVVRDVDGKAIALGLRCGDPLHNLFRVDAVAKPVTRDWMSKDRHGNVVQRRGRGKCSEAGVSTAAHGDTICWKHDGDYLTAEGAKACR